MQKHAYLVQICPRIQKMAFIFLYGNKKCQKLHLKNVTSSPVPSFFRALNSKKQRYCFEILHTHCLYVFRLHIFRFLDNLKILDFIGNYFWKIKTLNFWDQNNKISQLRDSHFVERLILRRLAFSIVSYIKTEISSSLEILAVFFTQNSETWRH